MLYDKLKSGSHAPFEVQVVVEISMNSGPIKYEFDKEIGALVVDRIMQTTMQYPCNYGFIPHTLSGDDDPVDVLVYTNHPILAGAVVAARPIGVLLTEDEKGQDAKILAVPSIKVDPFFSNVNSHSDLPEILLQKIQHFFTYYKGLEKDKWVKVKGWDGTDRAYEIINAAITRAS